MKYIAPNYYKAFSCLAGQCQHSCCIGWEIDVDEAAFQRYQSTVGQMGQRLRASISQDGGTPHFILAEGDRCPLLRQDGLCDMILQPGEDALCQICADHPRFRNYFSDQVELGLGLCCEAAGGRFFSKHPLFPPATPQWIVQNRNYLQNTYWNIDLFMV